MAKYSVIMVRHGESKWIQEKKFCGWFDTDLAEAGVEEAKRAGRAIKQHGYTFDVAFTSVLKRAIKTLFYIQDESDQHWIPVHKHWRLNERMYGALQGLIIPDTIQKHGEQKVKMWRRSYGTPPPPVDTSSEHYPANDPKYKHVCKNLLPKSESLKDTQARVLPYWTDVIVPEIKRGQRVIISAHNTCLRALIKYIDNVGEDEIMELNIPTGIPMVYELDEDLNPVNHFYLASNEEVSAGLRRMSEQSKDNKCVQNCSIRPEMSSQQGVTTS